MPYLLLIKKPAQKILLALAREDRKRIAEKIMWLGENPDDLRLDIKMLTGSQYYRLRVGKWRVIFDRNDEVRIIAIEKIKPRGDAYK